jgi:hypothetical protein
MIFCSPFSVDCTFGYLDCEYAQMHYCVVIICPETNTRSFQPTKVHPLEVKTIKSYVNINVFPIHNKFLK